MKQSPSHFVGALIALLASVLTMKAAERPNILYLMADDHSTAAIGAYATTLKNVVQTPELDRLASEGGRFTNVQCINSLCAPSRATIITGLYSHQTGVYTLRENLNTADIPSLPKGLQAHGYQTAAIGKWHVHGDNLHGFDYYAITRSQGAYFNPALGDFNGEKIRLKGYSSDVLTDHSIEWLQNRDSEKPFFLMLHFKATHSPWQYAQRHESLFADTKIPEPPTLFDDHRNRDPNGLATAQSRIHKTNSKMSLSLWFSSSKKGSSADWPSGEISIDGLSDIEKAKATYQKYAKDYLRCVKGIDENVGRIRAYLEESGQLENTIIIYTSDQGMYVGEHGLFDKRLGLDPAMRMPLIIRYPKQIAAGSVHDALINNVDYAETILDMTGAPIPASMQGFSFWGLATEQGDWNRRQSLYQFYSNGVSKHYGLVTETYKLLKYVDKNNQVSGFDLFDRKNDPHELQNLATNPEYATILAKMEAALAAERQSVGLTDALLPGSAKTGKPTK